MGAGFRIGIHVEMIVQVFHRILDLKHGPGFLPGAHLFRKRAGKESGEQQPLFLRSLSLSYLALGATCGLLGFANILVGLVLIPLIN